MWIKCFGFAVVLFQLNFLAESALTCMSHSGQSGKSTVCKCGVGAVWQQCGKDASVPIGQCGSDASLTSWATSASSSYSSCSYSCCCYWWQHPCTLAFPLCNCTYLGSGWGSFDMAAFWEKYWFSDETYFEQALETDCTIMNCDDNTGNGNGNTLSILLTCTRSLNNKRAVHITMQPVHIFSFHHLFLCRA